jgi:hypothetical protein
VENVSKQKNYLPMTSVTYAMKAKDFLESKGVRCTVERTPKNLGSGCGYSVGFWDSVDKIVSLLDGKGIPHKSVEKMSGGGL